MAANILLQLDDSYETLGLLFFGACADLKRKYTIEEMDKLGMDGKSYYDQHFRVLDHYIAAFQERRVATEIDSFFSQGGENPLFLFLSAILCRHKEWFGDGELPEDEALRAALMELIPCGEKRGETPVTAAQAADMLNASTLSAGSKWEIAMFLLYPRKYVKNLAEAISKNTEAYRYALGTVSSKADHLLQQYRGATEDERDKTFLQIQEKLAEDAAIAPALITPLMIMLPTHHDCYYGLLHEKTLKSAKRLQLLKNFCCFN